MPYINSIRGNHRGQQKESYPEEIYNITGGDKVYKMGGYKIHMFTTVGDHEFNLGWNEKYSKAMGLQGKAFSITASYLVIAGGGSGGNFSSTNANGGGGAGGYRTGSATVFGNPAAGSTVPVTVGSGGTAISPGSNSRGNNGTDSIIGSITSTGGGGGGNYGQDYQGRTGGSGGGPGGPSPASQGIAGQGNGAPSSGWYTWTGCGSGGAGTGGGTSSPSGYHSDGGRGTSSSISGSAIARAGGAGGGGNSSEPSGDGYDGGGKGYGSSPRYGYTSYPTSYNPSNNSWGANPGIPNTGGGGGAGSYWSPNSGVSFQSGTGGTGLVIISYPG
jgi:hypothetical protein